MYVQLLRATEQSQTAAQRWGPRRTIADGKAPVVAAAFHPSLAPVGVLLAVLGYALGTYGALICGYLMQAVAP